MFFYAKIVIFCENLSYGVKMRFLQSLKITFVKNQKFYREAFLWVRK